MNYENIEVYKNFKISFLSIHDGLKLFFHYKEKQSLQIKIIHKFSFLFFPLVENLSHNNCFILKNVFESTVYNIFTNYVDKKYLQKINKNFTNALKNYSILYGSDTITDFFIKYFSIYFILPLGQIKDFKTFENIIIHWKFKKISNNNLYNCFLNGILFLQSLEDVLFIDWNIGYKIALIIGLIYEIYKLGFEKSYFDDNTDYKFFALCNLIHDEKILLCENYPYVLYLLIDWKKKYFTSQIFDVLQKLHLFDISIFNMHLIEKNLKNKDLLIKLADYYS